MVFCFLYSNVMSPQGKNPTLLHIRYDTPLKRRKKKKHAKTIYRQKSRHQTNTKTNQTKPNQAFHFIQSEHLFSTDGKQVSTAVFPTKSAK